MSGRAMTARAEAADPLHAAGETISSAIQGARDGASEVLPAAGRFLSRMIYTTSYGLSYGIVFPTMMVVRLVPKDNALVHGLIDGAIAAREQVFGVDEGLTAEQLDETDADAEEADHAKNGRPSANSSHRRRGATKRGATRKSSRSTRKT